MKILIVGINSLLSHHITNIALQNGAKIYGIYNNNKQRVNKTVKLYTYNELSKLDDIFDYVFLIAAVVPYANMNKSTYELVDSNVLLVSKISKQFPSAKLILSSSISVYSPQEHLITEESKLAPPHAYGYTKLFAEIITKQHKKHAIIRLSSLYGEGMSNQGFIMRALSQAKNDNEIVLWGDGSRTQNYLHYADAANYLWQAAMSEQSDTYLGVAPMSYSNEQIAELISENFENCDIKYVNEDSSFSHTFNNSKTNNSLNITEFTDIREGIKELL